MAPPGMPKMSVTPAASSDVTRLCAPVICSLIPALPLLSSLRGDRACSASSSQQKTPRPALATRGDARSDGSGGASHAYEDLLVHGATVVARPNARHLVAEPSHHTGRASQGLAAVPSRPSAVHTHTLLPCASAST